MRSNYAVISELFNASLSENAETNQKFEMLRIIHIRRKKSYFVNLGQINNNKIDQYTCTDSNFVDILDKCP